VACQVVQVKREQHNVYEEEQIGIQVGAANTEWKRLDKSERGHFFRAGVPPKKVLMEFKVSPDAVLPIGAPSPSPSPSPSQPQPISPTAPDRTGTQAWSCAPSTLCRDNTWTSLGKRTTSPGLLQRSSFRRLKECLWFLHVCGRV